MKQPLHYTLHIKHFTARRSRAMTALEAVVSVMLATGFIGSALTWQSRAMHQAREIALRAQLRSLRASLAFFEARHGERPKTLEVLAEEEMDRLRAGGGSFAQATGKMRELQDPFGRRYAYDWDKGTIWSRTSGYAAW